jgi:hypothetical protein
MLRRHVGVSRSTLFDHVYVDQSLLGGMERVRTEMDELLFYLQAVVTGSAESAADGMVPGCWTYV